MNHSTPLCFSLFTTPHDRQHLDFDEHYTQTQLYHGCLQDATSDDIRELFSQYGTVRSGNGAITLKHNGGNNSFAYVDFMDIASAQACVDAKDVMLKDNIVRSLFSACADMCASAPALCCICLYVHRALSCKAS